MTTQLPEEIIIQHSKIYFGERVLHAIVVGEDVLDYEHRSTYKFHRQIDESKLSMCTALRRGYVSTYILDTNGELTLVKIEYPFTENLPDEFNEKIRGDFWLDMRASMFSDSLYVPFTDGKVVLNQDAWVTTE